MKYEIKVPKHCNKNWNEMTSTTKGAFCSSCKKEVIDFTNLNTSEISKLIELNSNICGKFKNKQLGVNHEIKHTYNIKYLLSLSSLLSFLTPIFSQNLPSESIKTIKQYTHEKESINIKKNLLKTNTIRINGQVFDDYNETLSGVSIYLEDDKSYISASDINGNFIFDIDREKFKNKTILIFSFLGSETKKIRIYEKTRILKIRLESELISMGSVVIKKRTNIFQKIVNLFR